MAAPRALFLNANPQFWWFPALMLSLSLGRVQLPLMQLPACMNTRTQAIQYRVAHPHPRVDPIMGRWALEPGYALSTPWHTPPLMWSDSPVSQGIFCRSFLARNPQNPGYPP